MDSVEALLQLLLHWSATMIMEVATGKPARRRRSVLTTSSTPTCNYIRSLLQLFYCLVRLVVTTIYDPFTCKFPGCNDRCSASIAYPFPYIVGHMGGLQHSSSVLSISSSLGTGCVFRRGYSHHLGASSLNSMREVLLGLEERSRGLLAVAHVA
jgi:hypothetical protein